MNPPRQSVLILIVADLSPRSSRYSREEISGLHWQELDRAGREMRLSGDRTKNGEPTTIPLNDLAVAELDKVATRLRFTVQPASRSNAVTRR
ncbi:hypothetical protein OSJ57_07670 [Sphingomonas sp. HH69]